MTPQQKSFVKEGRYYTNRVGEMAGPMARIAEPGKNPWGWDRFEFERNGTLYHADGTCHMHKDERMNDLIAEVIVINQHAEPAIRFALPAPTRKGFFARLFQQAF